MHNTAMRHGKLFFDNYVEDRGDLTIVDIGAQDVNGSLRSVAPPSCKYIGVDFAEGRGVDVVIDDPYALPFDDASVDVCISSSCFEHSEFFWLSFLEAIRILKPTGLLYLNVPSNGYFHRFPVDCWRFYPDSGVALQNWAVRNDYDVALLESFIGKQKSGVWNDFVAVFARSRNEASSHPRRIQSEFNEFTNGWTLEQGGFARHRVVPEDQLSLSWQIRFKLQRLARLPL
jgi:SAM-dependent methyltransferase